MLLQIFIVWKDSPVYGGSKDKKPDCNQFNWKQAELFLRLLCGKCVFMCLRRRERQIMMPRMNQ